MPYSDGDIRAVGQGDGKDWPPNCLVGGLARMTFDASAHPPSCAGLHISPPREAFKHFEGGCDTEMTVGISLACMYDPCSGQFRHIDTDGAIETGTDSIRSGVNCDGVADKQYSVVVPLEQATFGDNIKYVCGVGPLVQGEVVIKRRGRGHNVVLVPSRSEL